MKQLLFLIAFFRVSLAFADDFTNILQDLAKQTACLGKYSNTEAGNYNIPDPHDYYTPEMMAQRFSKMSGIRTKIDTFYGVCFDYAQAAWDNIKRYQSSYNTAGMLNQEWYIAVVGDNPNCITLCDPIPENRARWNGYGYIDTKDGKYLEKHNGVYCKKKKEMYVQSHGNNTTWHAWLWVQRTDGTWYWIDPTWTDNTGYVWYGKVSDDREIPLMPDTRYCVTEPPAPYIADNKQKPSTQNKKPNYKPSPSYHPSTSRNYDIGEGYGDAIGVLYGVPFYGHEVSMYDYYQEQDSSTPFSGYSREKELLRYDRFTCSLFMAGIYENPTLPDVGIVSLDYIRSNTDNEDVNILMLSLALGPSPFEHLGLYIGGGLGIGVDNGTKDADFDLVGDAKVDTGLLICCKPLMLRFDVAYDWVLGFIMCCGIGITL